MCGRILSGQGKIEQGSYKECILKQTVLILLRGCVGTDRNVVGFKRKEFKVPHMERNDACVSTG